MLFLLPAIGYGQNVKKCSTQDVLDEKIKNDPAIKKAVQNHFEQSKKTNSIKYNYSYPEIPGFEPTGDSSIDKRNFHIAKANLKNDDLQLYRQIIREHNFKNSEKNKRESNDINNQKPNK